MKLNAFQKLAISTVIATVFLIFVGGLVRASGAGLGCPDWPTCFGSWIPPTSANELPPEFNAGQFNAMKMWTEYINRLVGVIIGILITLTFISSLRYRKKNPAITYSSATALVMVLIQGWLGGRVVETGLDEWLITLHLILAVIIVNLLIFAAFKASIHMISIRMENSFRKKLFWAAVVLFVLTLIQLVFGTQVREAVDVIKNSVNVPPRPLWMDSLGFNILLHRSFSWLILAAGFYLLYELRKEGAEGIILSLGRLNLILILIQVASGVGMYYLSIPPALQVFHLVGIALMVCAQFLYILVLGMGVNRDNIRASKT